MSIAKKNRLEQAKIARAYIRGGTPPYQAARKCGFMRVSIMDEAIKELEEQEKCENEPADVHFEPNPQPKPVIYKPLKVYKNEAASIAHYGQNGDKAPMFKLSVEGTNTFLIISETNIKAVVSLLCEAAGLNGPESSDVPSKQELAELNDALTRENVKLCKRIIELEKGSNAQRIDELEAELEAEKAAHTALKLKVFDKLLALV